MISIVIIDDHPILVHGIYRLIEMQENMRVAGEANDPETALSVVEKTKPDIVLLDISLGEDINGLDLIPAIKKNSPESKILVLTMHENQYFLQKALEKGIAGYLAKKAIDVDLIYAIDVVHRGKTYIYPSLVDKIIQGNKETMTASGKNKDELLWNSLSERERQVMISLAHGLTNKEIANKYSLSEKTIGSYRLRGLEKLGFTSKTELVDFVFLKLNMLKDS